MTKQLLRAATALPALAALSAAAPPKAVSETRYWMSAETVSGLTSGVGGGQAKRLQLQLGSPQTIAAPSAEHLPPATLKAGASLPLTTPRIEKVAGWQADGTRPEAMPKTRMLLYWGCGEKAGPGQPMVLEFGTPAAAKVMASLTPAVAMMNMPNARSSATYGEWPNSEGRTTVPASGSLVGDHLVRGNYSPDIRFSLTAANDFLAPLAPRSSKLPSGAMQIDWASIPNARAYMASVMGAKQDGTMLLWSSSAVKLASMLMPDYLAQGDITRLVASKVLMAPDTTRCAVPSEVVQATEGAALQMTAFGPEANFHSPPGQRAWAAKLRSKSTHMGMLGMSADLGGLDMRGEQPPAQQNGQRPSRKRQLLRGLGSVLGVPR
ncbi:hypothetical protein GCM10022280_08840 [Sphingomonas swuensis]|uniref:Uncharacterized protein n=1 Tax=Sphingomonas swuensis TaxID=977800 RepID=A0ABP7SKG4_9SPHN